MRCFAHTLDLIAKIPEERPDPKASIDEIKVITRFFKKSGQAGVMLRRAQGKEKLGLKQSCPTRWNSVFIQMERFLLLKEHVDEILPKFKKGPGNISKESLVLIKDLMPILKHISNASKYSCGEQYVTASTLWPMIKNLRLLISQTSMETTEGKTCKAQILNDIAERFGGK